MTKQVVFRLTVLSLCLSTGLFAQQGTRPDPMAGQNGGQPTNTPQAAQDASPAEKPQPAEQNNAATAPAEVNPGTSTDQPGNPPASAPPAPTTQPPAAVTNPTQPDNTATNVELSAPITGAPETKILDSSAVGKHSGLTGAADPLLDTPALPKGKPTLIGGVATKVDRVRSRIVVEPFGEKKKMSVLIDERSHIFRNGVETTLEHVRKGDRVYFDTMLDGARVFAKNVRVMSETGAAEVRGQITSYDPSRGTIQLQDALSSRPVTFRISDTTHIRAQQGTASTSDLARGALIDVIFAPDKANRGVATQVTVLARPGVSYTFAGTITNVNLRDGVVSVENQNDGKVYDINFDSRSKSERGALRAGNAVNIAATFDGENYRATNVTVTEASSAPKAKPESKKPDDKDQ